MSIKVAKASLRQELKNKLATLTKEEVARQTDVVFAKLLKHEKFLKSKRISVYLSMEKEIGTLDIVKHILLSGKECFIPKYRVGGAQMDMVHLYSWEDFEKLPVTKWKIKQPAAVDDRPEALATGGLDLIIMPGLGFTLQGHRIGHGRGYYDSYLRRCMAQSKDGPYSIGLALKEQIVTEIPVEPSDYQINEVLVCDT